MCKLQTWLTCGTNCLLTLWQRESGFLIISALKKSASLLDYLGGEGQTPSLSSTPGSGGEKFYYVLVTCGLHQRFQIYIDMGRALRSARSLLSHVASREAAAAVLEPSLQTIKLFDITGATGARRLIANDARFGLLGGIQADGQPHTVHF